MNEENIVCENIGPKQRKLRAIRGLMSALISIFIAVIMLLFPKVALWKYVLFFSWCITCVYLIQAKEKT